VAIISFLTWVNELDWSIALRESTWMYPIVESVHSVGIALFVGLLLLWDLRLVGYGLMHMPVSRVWTRLFPWIVLGALIMMITGVSLFFAKPLYFWGNVYFRVKLATLFHPRSTPPPSIWGSRRRWSTGTRPRNRRLQHGSPAPPR